MALATNLSLFKVLGWLGVGLVILLWIGAAGLGMIKAAKTGDWNEFLSQSGGRIFALDLTLQEETAFLLDEENPDVNEKWFHFIYAFTQLLIFFIVAFLIYKFLNWTMGIRQFSPTTDLLIIALIILTLFVFEFIYTLTVLDKAVIPLSGVWTFIKNIPAIIGGMI